MKAYNQMLRDQLLAVLQEVHPLCFTTRELTDKMPWRQEWQDWNCLKYPGAAHIDNGMMKTLQCRITHHYYSLRPMESLIYNQLRAMERKGLCLRVAPTAERRLLWAAVSTGVDMSTFEAALEMS